MNQATGDATIADAICDRVVHDAHVVAIPPLGAGLGGLDWNDVRSEIERALSPITDVEVLVFESNGPPPSEAYATRPRSRG